MTRKRKSEREKRYPTIAGVLCVKGAGRCTEDVAGIDYRPSTDNSTSIFGGERSRSTPTAGEVSKCPSRRERNCPFDFMEGQRRDCFELIEEG